MKYLKLNNYKDYSIFFWIVLVSIIGIIITTIYTKNKEVEAQKIKGTLDNIYLKKITKEITNNLEPRYSSLDYVSKSGDTYQSIVDSLNIIKEEKKILLESILKEKSLKILRTNQKFTFKFDNMTKFKIIEFKIEILSYNMGIITWLDFNIARDLRLIYVY